MKPLAIFAGALMGVLFAMLEFYLYDNGLGLDSLLASIGNGFTISDFMILTFLIWVIVGLFLAARD